MNITDDKIDVLKELINIGMGRAAGVLNEMVSAHIKLQVPQVKIVSLPELNHELKSLGKDRLAKVQINFKGPFSGTAAMVLAPASAVNLVATLTGEQPGTADLDSVRAGTLTEVGNIVINGVMGTIVNVLKQKLSFSLPSFAEETIEKLFASKRDNPDATILLAYTQLSVEQLNIKGNFIVLFESDTFEVLLTAIDNLSPSCV